MPTAPPSVSTLPTPPSRDDPANFSARGDAFLAALPTLQDDIDDLAANVYANAVEAHADAVAADASVTAAAGHVATALSYSAASAASAQAAAASAGASIWVSGTAYSIGDVRWSPVTRYTYRRLTAGGGTTDPSADATNWALAGASAPQLVIVTGTTQAAHANGHYLLTNVAASTVTLPASPSAGDTVWVTPGNGLTTNVIARNGQPIMSLAEDMTINNANATVQLRYSNGTLGWRIV